MKLNKKTEQHLINKGWTKEQIKDHKKFMKAINNDYKKWLQKTMEAENERKQFKDKHKIV